MWTLHRLSERRRFHFQKPTDQNATIEYDEGDDREPAFEGGAASCVFPPADIAAFPVLRQQNLWCIQRHQATAHHYDLRLRVTDGLFSWAIPKGLMGERSR